MKDNERLKEKFLEYYRQLPIQKLAGASIGKDETTICRWKKVDADFANQIENAKAEWALEKVKRVRSNEWILERVIRDHFASENESEINQRLDELEKRLGNLLAQK